MRRNRLLTMILLLTIPFLPSLTVRTQQTQEEGKPLPDPAEYAEAGANCKRKVKVSPWVGVPGVDWPKTFQCVLKIHTCDGVKTYKSAVRPRGTGVCDDYWKVHNELANRMICCDCKEQKTQPWFDTGACDKPMRLPDPSAIATPSTGGVICTLTYSVCGLGGFKKREKYFSTGLLNSLRIMTTEEAKNFCASKGYGKESVPVRAVCCKKWNQAVLDWIAFRKQYGPPDPRPPDVPPGRVEPCSPSIDADCDGIYNDFDPTPLGDCAKYPPAPSPSP